MEATKLVVKTQNFARALERCSLIISSNPQPVVLKFVKVVYNAKNQTATIYACESNNTSGIICDFPVQSASLFTEDFQFLIDPKIAFQIITLIKAEEVTLEVNADLTKVTIKSGRGKQTLNAMPPKEFPVFPEPNSPEIFNVNSTSLKRMLSLVQPVINPRHPRPAFTGVCFDYFKDNLYLVGTDGFVMTYAFRESNITEEDFQLIFPNNSITPLVKGLPDGENVSVKYRYADPDNPSSDIVNMFFETSSFKLVVKPMDKSYQYPPWDTVIPGGVKEYNQQDIDLIFVVDKESLLNMVNLSATVADTKEGEVILRFKKLAETEGELEVLSKSDIGDAECTSIPCAISLSSIDKFTVSLDYKKINKILNVLNTKDIVVKYRQGKPLSITTDGSGDLTIGTMVCPIQKSEPEEVEEEISEEEVEAVNPVG